MGYAIFAARKLSLTNRLNQLNFRIMQLSQQQQTLSQTAGDMERVLSMQYSFFNNMGQLAMNNMFMQQQTGQKMDPSIFSQVMQQVQQMYMMNSYMDWQASSAMRQVKDRENLIELERKTLETQAKAVQTELQKVEEAEDKAIERSAPKFA